MAARLSAFVIWALVAGCFAFWGLRLFVPTPATPSYAVNVGEVAPPRGDLGRLLGTPASPVAVQPEAASRFALSGVLAPPEGFANTHGVALISVDGKPPRAYHVGARLVDDWVLQGVTRRSASLGPDQAAAAVVLELPERPAPATGSLPQLGTGEGTGDTAAPSAPPATPPASMQPGPPAESSQPAPSPAPQEAAQAGDVNAPGPVMGHGPPRRGANESR